MPTATLKTAASFTIQGQRFENGIEQNCTRAIAEYLEENEPNAFRIRMNRSLEEQVKPPAQDEDIRADMPNFNKMPLGDALRAAADHLNADIESNFEVDGRPTVLALQTVLQRKVTEDERDAEFHTKTSRRASTERTREPEAERNEQNNVVPKTVRIVSKARPTDDTEGAVAV